MSRNSEAMIWVVSGSTSPFGSKETLHSGVDGYEVYIILGSNKFKLNNTELEQYRVDADNNISITTKET